MNLHDVTLVSLAIMVVSAFVFGFTLNESQQVDLDLYDKGDETASERFNVSLSNTQEGLLRVVLLSLIVSVCTGAVVIADVIAGLI